MNSKLHAVCDGRGRPLVLLLTEGQLSDFKGAALMFDALPSAKALLGDKGYDADWFRNALAVQGIQACIPPKANRKEAIEYDKLLYRQRHKIENMFGRIKDWRRIHTRYDRCADIFMGAITIWSAPLEVIHPLCWSEDHLDGWNDGKEAPQARGDRRQAASG